MNMARAFLIRELSAPGEYSRNMARVFLIRAVGTERAPGGIKRGGDMKLAGSVGLAFNTGYL